MKRLSLNEILAAKDLPTKVVDLSEYGWPGEVEIVTFSLKEHQDLRERIKDMDEVAAVFEWLLVGCIDENGEKLFDRKHIEKLYNKNFEPLKKLFHELVMLNTISQEVIEKKPEN